ncbi:MAG: DUF58 domain-containing protein [Rhodobacteraceae bacterium]|nr:DUF58 domain-containing protein [Paracoccaceae bacterium]
MNQDHREARELLARAEAETWRLPPLLSPTRMAQSGRRIGAHGKRRAGTGYQFWQFRNAVPGEAVRQIDWRKSARSDACFVREKEQQSANTVLLWVDNSASMRFSGSADRGTKADRGRLLALCICMLLMRGEERLGLLGRPLKPDSSQAQLERIAEELLAADDTEYGVPPVNALPKGASIILISDFFGPWSALETAIRRAAGTGAMGIAVQLLDPIEIDFPFSGRTRFETPGGSLTFETMEAAALRETYRGKLRQRQRQLAELTSDCSWQCQFHDSAGPATDSLLFLSRAIAGEH